MKSEDLYNGITDLRDDLILEAEQKGEKQKKPRHWIWVSAVAATLAVVLLTGLLLNPWGSPLTGEAQALALAVYPETVPYPDLNDYYPGWVEAMKTGTEPPELSDEERERISEEYEKALERWYAANLNQTSQGNTAVQPWDFVTKTGTELLTGDQGENKLCSPLNLYMGLAMLAETTGGDTRAQVLSLLGEDSIEQLRADAKTLWEANYRDDGASTCILGSSLWLDQNVNYDQSTVDRLAETYYASSYRGKMGSDAMDQLLREWISQQTKGSLDDTLPGIQTDPRTVMALVSTVAYDAQWYAKFRPENTKPGTFHSPAGDTSVEYLYEEDSNVYYWAEHFGAVRKILSDGGCVWFLLPDEGVSPETLAGEAQTWDFLEHWSDWEDSKHLKVRFTVPKLDLTAQAELSGSLQDLGLTDAFDPALADFTPLVPEGEGIALTQATHAVRFLMDEEGCRASAYFVMMAAGAGMPPEEVMDFTLDRPFLFVLTNPQGLPLFCGVVNQP